MSGIPTSEVLYRAADLVAFHGLAYGSAAWSTSEDGICVEGAITAAADIPLIYEGETFVGPNATTLVGCPAYRAVHGYLDLARGVHLWRWNDESDDRGKCIRTAAEVIATLRAAAVIEAAKENTEAREQVAS